MPADELPDLLDQDEIDGRRGTYGAARVRQIVEALTADRGRQTVRGQIYFDDAVFPEDVALDRVRFAGRASFRGATFEGRAEFVGCLFELGAVFSDAEFKGEVEFVESHFVQGVQFEKTIFQDDLRFDSSFDDFFAEEARFANRATFLFARSPGRLLLARARFEGPVHLAAHIDGELHLSDSVFDDTLRFSRARCRELNASKVRLARGGDVGVLLVDETANLQEASFAEAFALRLRADRLDLRRVVVSAGGLLAVDGPEIALDGASFGGATTIAAHDLGVDDRPDAWTRDRTPRLGSMNGADVGTLTLDGIDLREARFAGAHNLDTLRLEGAVRWPQSPRPQHGRRRITILDEHLLRGSEGETDWLGEPVYEQPEPFNYIGPLKDEATPPAPARVAGLYRGLRKGREDAKDAPGATDFYFGEMTMRRRAERGPLLLLYWISSGYGTKPSWSLAWYVGLVAASCGLMSWIGFEQAQSLGRALAFVLGSTVYVARPPEGGLTAAGDLIQVGLRLLGPLLLGLTLLALRTRVKR